MALVVLVYDLTGSGVGVAGAVMFEVAPVLLLGPVAGLAADRRPRRRVMVGADVFRAVVAAALVVASDSLAVAYAAAFGLSAGAVVFNPAAGSLLPEVVGEDDVVPPTAPCGRPRCWPRSPSPPPLDWSSAHTASRPPSP